MTGRGSLLSTPEQIIEDARNGRMFILVDDENGAAGDLVIPAQMVTPDAINFMATHGRGLICLALTKRHVDALGLKLMSSNNRLRHENAFTVSIEARDGVTTGISAADRARTIAVAIDAANGPERIVTPGHVFPIVARPGGVLVRAGHAEAAVDVARLAGLVPAGVICEIMNDDGTMARLDNLAALAGQHALRIGSIRDLIAYRRKYDHDVVKVSETRFVSRHGGEWRAVSYHNKAVGNRTVALIKGKLSPDKPALVRMHQLDLFRDTLGEDVAQTGLLQSAMRMIGEEGNGMIVLINHAQPDTLSWTVETRSRGSTAEATEMREFRDYGIGAQILAELGVHEMVLLTNNAHAPVALAGYGITIVGQRPLAGLQ
jgi:3,4-dihydroxy 2-butanone 4-phosphate synthase/GTP cyclohydrolase II